MSGNRENFAAGDGVREEMRLMRNECGERNKSDGYTAYTKTAEEFVIMMFRDV